jgi:hypothetical protein
LLASQLSQKEDINMALRTKALYLGIALVGILGMLIASHSIASSQPFAFPQPTSAPSPTPGNALPEQFATSVVYKPVETAAAAVEMALYDDAQRSVWKDAWSAETLKTDPGRIQVEEFASRGAESADAGRNEEYSAEIEADAGGVWRVTIKGEVQVAMIGMGVDPNARYDGVTYVISKRTGNLLAVITGAPLK